MEKIMANLVDLFVKGGLRKLSYAFYVQAILAYLILKSKISSESFVELSMYLAIGVFAGNAVEHLAKIRNGASNANHQGNRGEGNSLPPEPPK